MATEAAPSPFADETPTEEHVSVTEGSPFYDEMAGKAEETDEADETSTEEEEKETSEEEESETESEETDEDLSDEELDELIDELLKDEDEDSEDSEDTDDEDDTPKTVPHEALHKERMRRKELQAVLEQQQLMAQEAYQQANSYKQVLDKVMEQLDELGVKDFVKVEMPEEVSPEKLAAQQKQMEEQQQQQVMETITTLRQEAMLHIDEFPAIDPENSEQGELVLGYALAAVALGKDPEEAILHGMTILNQHLANAKKMAVRKASSKPKKKTPAKKKARRTSPEGGGSLFDRMAENMLENR